MVILKTWQRGKSDESDENTMLAERVCAILEATNLQACELPKSDRWKIRQCWLEKFGNEVKRRTGRYVYRGHMWHGFSFGFQPCWEGNAALDRYFAQSSFPFYIFDESDTWAFLCDDGMPPDFSGIINDCYVCDVELTWTMVFTHEPHVSGPFFATAELSEIGTNDGQ